MSLRGHTSATPGVDSFREATGNLTRCEKCPAGYSTGGKTGESSCLKNPGLTPENCGDTQFLRNENSDPAAYATWSCETCPSGGTCNGPVQWKDVVGPTNKSNIRALFGWSRCSQTGGTVENMFERCTFAAACLGAPNPELEGKFEGGVATQNNPEGCNEAYRNDSSNFLCSACAPGFSHTAGDTSGKCDKCPLPGENEGIAAGHYAWDSRHLRLH